MRVFRLCASTFAALDGEGSKRNGGRWNHRGYSVVYASTHLSLALLELLVHLDIDLIPNLNSIEIEIPAGVSTQTGAFPKAWLKSKDDVLLQEVGTEWLKTQQSAVLIVPSVVVPNEQNVLINPLHPQASRIRIARSQPFQLDARLTVNRK
jgi:RES domain-containing protein